MDGKNHRLLDGLAAWWEKCGRWLGHRPAQIIFMLSALVATVLVLLSLATAFHNKASIEDIQAAFCNGGQNYDAQQRENCHKLLTQLLKDPTPEQKARIRQIATEGK